MPAGGVSCRETSTVAVGTRTVAFRHGQLIAVVPTGE